MWAEGYHTFVRRLTPAPEQNFPQYAVNFVRRFVTGSYASVSSSIAPIANASAPLTRDTFGFRKVIVAATAHGKVYGLDSADGTVLWSRVFGLGWAAEVGGQVIPVKIFTTRTVSDGDAPQVVVVTQRKANNVCVSKQTMWPGLIPLGCSQGLVDTVLFHVDALTGEDARGVSVSGDLLQGFDIIAGPLVEAYLLRSGSKKFAVLLDEFVQVSVIHIVSASRSLRFRCTSTLIRKKTRRRSIILLRPSASHYALVRLANVA